MAAFELRDIEFRSDGSKDSLTSSMSPELFHAALKREISAAKRDERELAILTIALRPQEFASLSLFQEELIQVAFALEQGLRGGDFFARISDRGFWALLRTSASNGQLVVDRLDLPRHDSLTTKIVARKYDEYSEWIERVDQLFFNG